MATSTLPDLRYDAGSLKPATTGVQGSGRGILGYEPLSERLILEQVYEHDGNVGVGTVPPMVFDAGEHAYHVQHRSARPDYVTRLWDLVDWRSVAARSAAAKTASTAPFAQLSAAP